MSIVIDGTLGVSGVQDGIISESKLATGAVTDGKLSLTPNSQEVKDALNATGSAPIYACRAWVDFNGQGTVAIRASGNVSSITDNGTGDYTVNFTTAITDTNYVVCASNTLYSSARAGSIIGLYSTDGNNGFSAKTIGSVRILTMLMSDQTNAGTVNDLNCVEIAIFR